MANWKYILDLIENKYGNDVGKMLIHTGAMGWILSSAAQILAIKVNDKVPKEQKTYMMLQEFADGCINVLSFYLLTQTFKAVGAKLISSGKFTTNTVRNFLDKLSPEEKSKVGKISTNIMTDIKNIPEDVKESYKKFDNGMGFITTLVGSIISCNFLTPVLRNMYATKQSKVIQKHSNSAKMDAPMDTTSQLVVRTFQRPSLNTFINSSGSSLKI